jgi:hypothetical protein
MLIKETQKNFKEAAEARKHYARTSSKTVEVDVRAQVRDLCEQDLCNYIKTIAPYAVMGKVHEEICDFLTEKKSGNLYKLVLIPRAHRKSFLMAMFTAREIACNPTITILYISATSELAEAQLRIIKQTLESPKHMKYWPTLINAEEGKREKWTNTEINVDHPSRKTQGIRDCTLKAAGLTTNITGLHVDLIILDDLVVPDNNTVAGRKLVSERYSQLQSILNPGGRIVAAGTRYDPNDLYSTLQATKEEIYNRNGEYVGERDQWAIFQRVVEIDGEFLWPRTRRADGKYFGFDMKELSRIYSGYSDKIQFYAQYYNDPNRAGSAAISPEMFEYYDPEKLHTVGGVWHFNGDLLNVYAAMDFAYTLGDTSDWSVIAVVGIDAYKNRYVLAVDRFKTDNIRDYYQHLVKAYDKWRFKKIRMEATAAQSLVIKQLKGMLKDDGIRFEIEEYKPTRDKAERVLGCLKPLYDEHKVYHYKGGNCEILEEELTQARPEHDDTKNAVADAMEICVAPSGMGYRKSSNRQLTRLGRFGGSCYVANI